MPAGRSDSSLLTRLPAEARLRVWELAIGGNVIHPYKIASDKGHDKMACAICPIPDAPMQYVIGRACAAHYDKDYRFYNVKTKDSAGNYPMSRCRWHKYPDHNFHPLPLLLSCKAIYNEAAPVLYRSTTFAFYHLEAVLHFVRLVPARHLSHIRHLVLTWTFMTPLYGSYPAPPAQPIRDDERHNVFDRTTWAMTCRSIQHITDLRDLTVKLYERPFEGKDLLKMEWPTELRRLRPKDSFDVIYECCGLVSSEEQRPILVQRTLQSFGDIPFRILVPDYNTKSYITLDEWVHQAPLLKQSASSE